jgi:hypothetical protein
MIRILFLGSEARQEERRRILSASSSDEISFTRAENFEHARTAIIEASVDYVIIDLQKLGLNKILTMEACYTEYVLRLVRGWFSHAPAKTSLQPFTVNLKSLNFN